MDLCRRTCVDAGNRSMVVGTVNAEEPGHVAIVGIESHVVWLWSDTSARNDRTERATWLHPLVREHWTPTLITWIGLW